MAYKDMVVGLRYIVVKPSVNGEFQIGDHILLLDDDGILCSETGGWIDKEDVESATESMVVEIDKEWVNKEKEKLNQRLKELENV